MARHPEGCPAVEADGALVKDAGEAVFRVVRRQERPERRYPTWESLEAAIEVGCTHAEQRLLQKCAPQPGRAA